MRSFSGAPYRFLNFVGAIWFIDSQVVVNAVFLSMFPLTAPVSMMTRLSATQVPFWQASLALLLLALTAVFLVRASASLFKAQNLLTGQTFTVAGFLKALAGK